MTIYFFNWLLLFKIDAAAAGIYGACMTIVLLANPLLNGAMSAFAPTAAIEYQASGKAGLNKILWRFGTGLVVVMLLFSAFLLMACGHPKYNFFSSLAGLLAVVGLGAMMREPDLVSCALCFSISIAVVLAFRSYFYWAHSGDSKNSAG